ncbi:MAG: GTPase Era [Candidatus Fervidibacter sp.]|uniref:GTPase Era n=1 Tax=Candidatus Fervidibacter sp. TaxID=3100871 RepID=UPI004049ADA9
MGRRSREQQVINEVSQEFAVPSGFKSGYVVLWGKPNVGKSTLLNYLVGEKIAVVSPKPQTTRNRIVGVVETENAQIVFLDTPGVHHPRHKLGEYLVAEARASLESADIVLFMVDVTEPPTPDDERAAQLLNSLLREAPRPVLLVVNKIDAVSPAVLQERKLLYEALGKYDETLTISALTGENVPLLLRKIIDRLPEGPPYYPLGTITDQPEKLPIAEAIREAVLHYTHEEVPHAVAVIADEIEHRSDELAYVKATIFVEKESQKGIIIGQGGHMLKKIGTMARTEIERWLGKKVYLDLWVKVAKNWRKDENALRRFGYFVKR